MMNKKIFAKETNKLVTEYENKGFTMSKEKAEQWYEILKTYTDEELKNAVCEYIENNNFIPTIADILKIIKSYRSMYPDRTNYEPGD